MADWTSTYSRARPEKVMVRPKKKKKTHFNHFAQMHMYVVRPKPGFEPKTSFSSVFLIKRARAASGTRSFSLKFSSGVDVRSFICPLLASGNETILEVFRKKF